MKGKTVVFFDVDGTLLRGNINTAILLYLFRKKILSPAMLVRSVFWYSLWCVGVVRDVGRIAQRGAAELAGVSEKHLCMLVDEAFQAQVKRRIYQEAVSLIESHRTQGHEVILLSSSFEPFIQKVASYLGISDAIGTRLAVEDGVYTGAIDGDIVWGNKHHIVAAYQREYLPKEVYAYSDQHQDTPMLERVTNPVAVNPDYFLKREARKRGWKILWFSNV